MTKLSGDVDSEYLYTGHYRHTTSGLYLAPYRAYDAEVGCWLRRTHADSKQLNIKADIALFRGRFFSLEFSQPPKDLSGNFEVQKTLVHRDPMTAISEMGGSSNQQEQLLSSIDAKLPNDYVDLVTQNDSMTINGWIVYGLTSIRKSKPNTSGLDS